MNIKHTKNTEYNVHIHMVVVVVNFFGGGFDLIWFHFKKIYIIQIWWK